jgi:hypothetical protein
MENLREIPFGETEAFIADADILEKPEQNYAAENAAEKPENDQTQKLIRPRYIKAVLAVAELASEESLSKKEQRLAIKYIFAAETDFRNYLQLSADHAAYRVTLSKANDIARFSAPNQKNIPILRNYALELIEGQLPKIQEAIKSGKPLESIQFFEALLSLLSSGNLEHQKLGRKVILELSEKIEQGLKSKYAFIYSLLAGIIIEKVDPEHSSAMAKAYQEYLLSNPSKDEQKLLAKLHSDEKYNSIKTTLHKSVDQNIQQYHLDTSKFMNAWALSCKPEEFAETIKINLEAIHALEEQRPGAAKILSEEFGIMDFARYPIKILLAQYDARGSNARYGVNIFPRDDHSGACYTTDETQIETFEAIAGKYDIKIIEVASKVDLYKKLHRLHKRYGKMSFGIFSGHGNVSTLSIGERARNDFWTSSLQAGSNSSVLKGLEKMNEYFEPDAKLVLDACYSGAQNGPAQKISKALNKKVYSFVSEEPMDHITPIITESGIDFSIHLVGTDQKNTRAYFAGKRV